MSGATELAAERAPNHLSARSEQSLAGRVCIVTGGTSGIGRATAVALAGQGARVVIVGRNEARARRALSTIARLRPPFPAEFEQCDLATLGQVRKLARTLNARHGAIDVLVNNAGARFDTYGETPDRVERTFATNHLGPFLLTCSLLDSLLAAPAARIITVASCVHASASAGDWCMSAANYNRRMAYAQSKLANILFASELARRLHGTRAASFAVDPGIVASRFARNNGWLSWAKHLIAHGVRRELVRPAFAAQTIVHVASAPGLADENGGYFSERRRIAPAPVAQDESAGRELWNYSLELVGRPPVSAASARVIG